MPLREAGRAPNRIVGSMGYLAPEILCGATASAAADLFAVGVMAHELLLGEHPLAPLPRLERLHGFVGTAPIFTQDARLSPDLSQVLRRALCRSPAERYDDALVFARELAQAAQLYHAACVAGASTGCEHLAAALSRGRGVSPDQTAASQARDRAKCVFAASLSNRSTAACPAVLSLPSRGP